MICDDDISCPYESLLDEYLWQLLNFMIMAVFPNVQFKMHQIIMKAPQFYDAPKVDI